MANKSIKKFSKIDLEELVRKSETLLANIQFASIDEPVKTVLITSTGPDEGKSTTALALATAMAKAGKRTLIMDCDMRRRSQGKLLGVHPAAGVYSVLSGRAPLKKAVAKTNIPNLYLLDCEPNIANPASVLASQRFAALLRALSRSFDYVVVDTPPIGTFVDAAVAAALVDGVALVVRQRVSKKQAVADALAQLKAADARILGLVMTFVPQEKSDYYYYYNEENRRVKKKHSDSETTTLQQTPAEEMNLDLGEDDMQAWARRIGVSAEDLREAPKAPVRHAGHAATPNASAKKASSSFAPGSFKG